MIRMPCERKPRGSRNFITNTTDAEKKSLSVFLVLSVANIAIMSNSSLLLGDEGVGRMEDILWFKAILDPFL